MADTSALSRESDEDCESGTEELRFSQSHPVSAVGLGAHSRGLSQAEAMDALRQAIDSEGVRQTLLPYAKVLSIGGGVGFMAGMATKKMGKTVGSVAISTAVTIQILQHLEFIDIRWDKMQSCLTSLYDKYGNSSYVQFAITNASAILLGLGLGIHFG